MDSKIINILKKIFKVFSINIFLILFFILFVEIFFGYWFDKDNFGPYMREHRMKNQRILWKDEIEELTYFYRRNYYGFRGIDIDPSKFIRAKELGATHCFDSRNNDTIEAIRDLTNGGVDFAIDLAGVIAAMDTAYQIIRYGGSVVTAGLSPINTQFSFNHSDLVAQEKSILGSYMGSCVPVRDVPRFLNLYLQGRLPVDKLIDGKITFENLNEGFDKLSKGEVVRQILTPNN